MFIKYVSVLLCLMMCIIFHYIFILTIVLDIPTQTYVHLYIGTVPNDVELFPRRVMDSNMSAFLLEHLHFVDPYDTRLYRAAKKMFREQIALVKITKNIDI